MSIQVIVNPRQRIGGVVQSEISVGNKILITPNCAPRIKKSLDFGIICDLTYLEKKPTVTVFEIDSVEDIMRERRATAHQFDLSMKLVDSNFKKMSDETVMIIDPRTEAFYYNLGKSGKIDVKSKLINIVGFQEKVAKVLESMDTEHYNAGLTALEEQDLLASYVDSYATYQAKQGADIVLPPAPLVTKSNLSLKLMMKVNERTRLLANMGRIRSYPAMYIPMQSGIFKDDKTEMSEKILRYIREKAPFNRFLFLKLAYYNHIGAEKSWRKGYGKFMREVDLIKEEFDNSFAVVLLDAGEEGYILLMNGIDVYSESSTGTHAFARSTKKKEDDEEAVIGPPQRGKYLHPEFGLISFDRLLSEIGEDAILPCNCPACQKYHGNLNMNTNAEEWNISRRSHLINMKLRDIDILNRGIEEGNVFDIVHKIDRGHDRNLIDLIPNDRLNNLNVSKKMNGKEVSVKQPSR